MLVLQAAHQHAQRCQHGATLLRQTTWLGRLVEKLVELPELVSAMWPVPRLWVPSGAWLWRVRTGFPRTSYRLTVDYWGHWPKIYGVGWMSRVQATCGVRMAGCHARGRARHGKCARDRSMLTVIESGCRAIPGDCWDVR
ncbi:hypothetical protein Salat_2209600 [Sesamum alatum]|uniref:Uncharacterized protein n=1 Tax=Sesamum alatum TaxID=300844 RepID=A0AAE1XTY1_9LAMI|nr:hypothetical protein Salat_2209600 [Sesamum alatum]